MKAASGGGAVRCRAACPARAAGVPRSRLLWITRPNSAPDDWGVTALRVTGADAAGGVLLARATILVRNYALLAPMGAAVMLSPELPGLLLRPRPGSDVALEVRVDGRSSQPALLLDELVLPFAGEPPVA